VVQFGHHLKETVLFPVPHRQHVFSIPKILRKFFLYNRKLLGKLSQCAVKSLMKFFKLTLGKKTWIPGVVVAIQSFGDYARWHPHLHALVAEGLFLESGYFFVMPSIDIQPLIELFRVHALKMFKKEGLIDEAFIKIILAWRHTSGFSVHNKVRNTFSLSKLQYNEETSSVIYRSKMSHGKNKKNFKVFSPIEFIAVITQHIPERSFQLLRYYGWYSNRMRGDRNKQEALNSEIKITSVDEVTIVDVRKYKPKRIPQLMWRECIKKVWEVDPLVCPKCTGEMKIISFIYKRTVIKKILTHLNLYEERGNQRAPPMTKKDYTERVEIVPCDDGWPGYEETLVEF
jgi:hypothetical protein